MTNHHRIRILAIAAAVALVLTGCQAESEDPIVDGTQPAVETEQPEQTPTQTAEPAPDATPTETETGDAGEVTPADVNGRWCAAPDSPVAIGCVTIEWPSATYDNGDPSVNLELLEPTSEGCVPISQGDAPFGSYCAAGIELDIPDENFPGSDYPDEDRIWNSQTGIMLLRE
jgi:hypothetical protein